MLHGERGPDMLLFGGGLLIGFIIGLIVAAIIIARSGVVLPW